MPSDKDSEKIEPEVRYAGLEVRLFAFIIDLLLFLVITSVFFPSPVDIYPQQFAEFQQAMQLYTTDQMTQAQYSMELHRIFYEEGVLNGMVTMFVMNMLLFAILILVFWQAKKATPGKMLFRLQILREKDLQKMGFLRALFRLLSYTASVLSGIGFFWALFNKKRQMLHDKLAGTVVVRKPRR